MAKRQHILWLCIFCLYLEYSTFGLVPKLTSTSKSRLHYQHSTLLCKRNNHEFHHLNKLKVFVALSVSLLCSSFITFTPPTTASASILSPPTIQSTPPDVIDIIKDRILELRSGVTGEKVGQLRVGESLFSRLRSVDQELENLQADIYRDVIDWEVMEVYPKIFRAFSPLFTAYTDRAFPSEKPVDKALRYALRYEVGSFYNSVQDLDIGIQKRNQRLIQRAFASLSLSYDRYLKAGDLFIEYDKDNKKNTGYLNEDMNQYGGVSRDKLSYVAPSLDAPGLQDDIVLLKGPDKGKQGIVLWISKGASLESANVVVKFQRGESGHSEVKLYPYAFVAKTTPPAVQFTDDLFAAYIASAISSGIMYPLDSFKTRQQTGRKGIPDWNEGGIFGLWKGVFFFIADANDAVYVASYGLLQPALLAPVNVENSLLVFWVSVLAGSIGDAFGSIFRVPMEIIYKQIQTGAAQGGREVYQSVVANKGAVRLFVLSWVAVLCRDMPFAGLQIALFDVVKNLLSFLDDYGVNVFVQRALWGAVAGSLAAWITTPFDVLTTEIIIAAQSECQEEDCNLNYDSSESDSSDIKSIINSTFTSTSLETQKSVPISTSLKVAAIDDLPSSRSSIITDYGPGVLEVLREVGPLFTQTMTDVFINGGGISALFNGAVARMLFFGPAAMIFFATYESLFDLITAVNNGHAFWQK